MCDKNKRGSAPPAFKKADLRTLNELSKKVRRRYINNQAVDNSLDFGFLQGLSDEDIVARSNRVLEVSKKLDGVIDVPLNFSLVYEDSPLESGHTYQNSRWDGDSSKAWVVYIETLLEFAAVFVDVTRQYPDIEKSDTVREINLCIEKPDVGRLKEVGELAAATAVGKEIEESLESAETTHPEETVESLKREIQESVEQGEPGKLRDSFRSSMSNFWSFEHLLKFDPDEFERLIADLFEDYGYGTRLTRSSRDRGVDVLVRNDSDEVAVMQVKRRSEEKVGIADVQRTAGLLLEFDAEKGYVVTSSSFTQDAKRSNKRIEKLQLINGEQLIERLTDSSLVHPYIC